MARRLRQLQDLPLLGPPVKWFVAPTIAIALITALPAIAYGDGGSPTPPIVVTTDNHQGEVTTDVSSSGSSPSSDAVTYQSASASDHCMWMRVYVYERLPLPPAPGGTKGAWWQAWCNQAGWSGMPVFVPTGTATAGALVSSPGVVAQQAEGLLRLPSPAVHLNPEREALVGLPEWFWLDSTQWRSLSQRTQAGPVWARVTAAPTSTTWDPGDGSPVVTCSGPGTPYDRSKPATSQSSDCTYTYTHSSAGQPQTGPAANDRFFTVTVTTTWSVSWVGSGGAAGTLPVISRSRTFPLRVAERQAVVTGGSG